MCLDSRHLKLFVPTSILGHLSRWLSKNMKPKRNISISADDPPPKSLPLPDFKFNALSAQTFSRVFQKIQLRPLDSMKTNPRGQITSQSGANPKGARGAPCPVFHTPASPSGFHPTARPYPTARQPAGTAAGPPTDRISPNFTARWRLFGSPRPSGRSPAPLPATAGSPPPDSRIPSFFS